MVFNTITVGSAVTPTVIETYFSHYINRKPLHQKPTAHVSYHEGINLIRQFLNYASHHTVEDIQGFTSQWVPSPRWVKVDEVTLPQKEIEKAADAICAQLGHKGIDKVGGQKWWQWRREGSILRAEWIEMRRDYTRRKQNGGSARRIMLYVHGGAYFFGSVDEHRYQMQRHARKLEARVFAREFARYRLAPQFPFPCGLHDCLAAYIYLLTVQSPSEIILAGDSAGGGMVLSLLVILRDQGLPLPAGAILISPWVDLTHSFRSVAGNSSMDYIPSHGFHQRPSASWPPPNADDMEQIARNAVQQVVGESLPRKSTLYSRQEATEEAVQGFSVDHNAQNLNPESNVDNPAGTAGAGERPGNTIPGAGHDLSIMLDGKLITIKDQIQMYTTNQLISHPLVSPVLQPSLGGLPPLLIQTGGGEVLRDEQIYMAHKAAEPPKYPPGDAYLDEYPEARDLITKWKPTDVQLQVWDDLCHVAPTLSFTRPAKYMYRSIAQFGAWALARAQKREIEIMDDDEMSVISSDSEVDGEEDLQKPRQTRSTMENGVAQGGTAAYDRVGKAGDPLPPFKNHMIRQRVDRHGNVFPLEPASSLSSLQMSQNEIGVIKPGPVEKWLKAKKEWDTKYAREKRKVQKQRAKEMAKGFRGFGDDDVPPPSALAGRRGLSMPKEEKKTRSWGMSLWALWGSSHDEETIGREEKADKDVSTTTNTEKTGANARPADADATYGQSRSKSRRRGVTDVGQSSSPDEPVDENTPAAVLDHMRKGRSNSQVEPVNDNTQAAVLDRIRKEQQQNGQSSEHPAYPTITSSPAANEEVITGNPIEINRPSAGGKAFPFKLGTHLRNDADNASTITLASYGGVVTPKGDETGKQLGENPSKSEFGGRRQTMEDANGVLHSGLAAPDTRDELSDGEITPTGEGSGKELGEASMQNGDMKRRQTMEDSKGVLHFGPVDPVKSDDSNDVTGTDLKRPRVERFETAHEEI